MSTLTEPFRHSMMEPQRDGLPEDLLVPAFGWVQIQARFSYLAQFNLLKGEQYQIAFSAAEPHKRGHPRIVFPNPRVTFTTCE